MKLDTVGLSLQRMLQKILMPAVLAVTAVSAHAAQPLKIGYSDYPAWAAWHIAQEKGWFKEAGVDVKLEWFDYSASIDAFSAGKIDAVSMTNGDALVTGASGAKSVMVLINDYSNGNDLIIAKSNIKSIKDLKGKKVAVELGLVDHLLLLNALKKAGLKESDVTLVNAKTNELPQVFAAPDIAAIGVWQPVAGEALKAVPGSRAIYTSADEPGLIYDVLAVNPGSAKSRKADWIKVTKVWDKIVAYIKDPKTTADAVRIMAARCGVSPAEYQKMVNGSNFLTLEESRKVYVKGEGFSSIYGSTKIVDAFNVANKVYAKPENIDVYLDPSITMGK